MTTHRLITPWPIGGASGLHTWCGRSAKEVASDRVATDPSAVTCARCTEAMRSALAQLSVDVPRLPQLDAAAVERDRLQHEVQMLRDQMRRRSAGDMVLASDVAEMLGAILNGGPL